MIGISYKKQYRVKVFLKIKEAELDKRASSPANAIDTIAMKLNTEPQVYITRSFNRKDNLHKEI